MTNTPTWYATDSTHHNLSVSLLEAICDALELAQEPALDYEVRTEEDAEGFLEESVSSADSKTVEVFQYLLDHNDVDESDADMIAQFIKHIGAANLPRMKDMHVATGSTVEELARERFNENEMGYLREVVSADPTAVNTLDRIPVDWAKVTAQYGTNLQQAGPYVFDWED